MLSFYNDPMISKPNLGLELHDSWLDSVDVADQTCRVALRPAYVYEIAVESGDVIGPCMEVDILFDFDRSAVDGVLGDLPDPILDGSLDVASEAIPSLIPLHQRALRHLTATLRAVTEHKAIHQK